MKSEGWKNIAKNLARFPLFAIATSEGDLESIPCRYCDVTEVLADLEKANAALAELEKAGWGKATQGRN